MRIFRICLMALAALALVFCSKRSGKQESIVSSSQDSEPTGSKVADHSPFEPCAEDSVRMDGGTAILDILGWSKDSRYFAFGQTGERGEPLDVESQGYGEFWLVDVEADRFVKDACASIRYTETESVTEEDVEKVRRKFAVKARKYGVRGDLLGEKLEKTSEDQSETCDRVEMKSRRGNTYELVMNKEFQYETYPVEGRFELILKDKESGKKVYLQKKGKYLLGRMGYHLYSAYIDPTNQYIAVITIKVMYGFEGAKVPNFMVNTGRLP
jgi:predicted secreted protein